MKSYKLIVAIAFTLIIATFFACKKDMHTASSEEKAFTPNYTLAKTSNELLALKNDPNANIIKTLAQFDANIAHSPLAKVPKDSLQSFRKSLVVRDGFGIVSLNYSALEQSLSYDDFAVVLSMFGIDAKQGYWGFSKDPKIIQKLNGDSNKRSAMLDEGGDDGDVGDDGGDGLTDHTGYWCKFPRDCQKLRGYICMTGC
jgi:hypothetical protein